MSGCDSPTPDRFGFYSELEEVSHDPDSAPFLPGHLDQHCDDGILLARRGSLRASCSNVVYICSNP